MKNLNLPNVSTSLNKFLFKDEYYNYCLIGRELVLRPMEDNSMKQTNDFKS